ncbi:uncharacterized protein LOC126827001 [Patella vulgata]|uniref:uncharacterized protein LOC126827001 n=1 Tax=Patella vulgata TaxID=6465 RepID=UPI0024A8D4AE|nr:uncharacterized protein LOC126827001 [Patella vulgata]XP_050412119.2 uncharacterized protein LOC126827001 [Patella vulgata]XP_050412120.2 uncharacterized protein LOC126827001 [Patella vulgata]
MAEATQSPNIPAKSKMDDSNAKIGLSPSFLTAPTVTPPDKKKYSLNKDRTMKKIHEAASRQLNVKLEHKQGKVVMELSASAFTNMTRALEPYYRQNGYGVSDNFQYDNQDILVETNLFIKNLETKKKLLTFCMYHTTCRILISGALTGDFLNEHVKDIVKSLDSELQLNELNKEIQRICLDKQAQKSSPKDKSTPECKPGISLQTSLEDWISGLPDDKKYEVISEQKLSTLVGFIGTNWESIVLHLGYSEAQINQATMKHPHNPHMQIFTALNKWRQREASKATFIVLMTALKECTVATIDWDRIKTYVNEISY